jgi:hypothetical protein
MRSADTSKRDALKRTPTFTRKFGRVAALEASGIAALEEGGVRCDSRVYNGGQATPDEEESTNGHGITRSKTIT